MERLLCLFSNSPSSEDKSLMLLLMLCAQNNRFWPHLFTVGDQFKVGKNFSFPFQQRLSSPMRGKRALIVNGILKCIHHILIRDWICICICILNSYYYLYYLARTAPVRPPSLGNGSLVTPKGDLFSTTTVFVFVSVFVFEFVFLFVLLGQDSTRKTT